MAGSVCVGVAVATAEAYEGVAVGGGVEAEACAAIAAFLAGHLNATATWFPPQLIHFRVSDLQSLYVWLVSAHFEQVSVVSVH